VSGNDVDNMKANEHISLFYKFELADMERIGTIDVREGINKVKTGLLKHKNSTTYKFYHSYIGFSVKRFMAQVLDDYSYRLLYDKCARKIQQKWLVKYYDPSQSICQKRLQRECCELAKLC
jgi:hypothetical protein